MSQLSISKTIDPKKRTLIAALLLISSFISLASQTMMITAVPVIQHTMHVELNSAQWLTTGYTLLVGIVTPLSSNLYEKYKNRTVFLTTLGTFIAGTILGCFAQSFIVLLLARCIQALASGILMSFQMTTMISIYPLEKRGSVLGISSLIVAFGPAIGPTFAGVLLNYLNWHYLFYLVLPIMVIIWILGFFIFPNYTTPQDIKIDFLSVILSLTGSSLALFSLTILMTQTLLALALLIIGLAILVIFVRRQLKLKQPMLKVDLFKKPSFRLLTLVGMLVFMVLLGTEQLLPIFTVNVLGISSMASGLILLPGAVLNALFAVFVGRYYDRHGPKLLIFLGVFLILAASIPFVFITKNSPVWLLTTAYAIRMIGNALVISPALSETFVNILPNEISHATALNNTLRQVAAAVANTFLIVIAGIPSSFITGMRLAMWVTVCLTILLLVLFVIYLKRFKKEV
ncbi:MFS transporter [Ligilactobacillus ceti]|uniref:Multidrug resistance protein B n=1 Tax=Ligilactobacillus ceti DSM 22408 TaxID=1122146 RepID=A0A0R2KSG5_9LACO|nr:MFS transporter [Ligilactobacillus ceti]KRN89239.1 multidrug resistance protein B [Ligilactobacillus ceti DSM 22408]